MMNVNAFVLSTLLPLILGVPSFETPEWFPQMTDIESSLLVCKNGHVIEGTNKYEFDVKNNSERYVKASSISIDGISSQVVLLDANTVLAPNENMRITLLLDQKEQAPDNISNYTVLGEGYISKPAKCDFEDVEWLSCEPIETANSTAYKYTFNMNPFNYTGTEDIIYTIGTNEGDYSFYGGNIGSDYHSFVLDKQLDMDTMKVSNVRSLQMDTNGAYKPNPDIGEDSTFGKGLIVAFVFPFIVIGLPIIGGVAIIIAIIIILIRSIRKKRHS